MKLSPVAEALVSRKEVILTVLTSREENLPLRAVEERMRKDVKNSQQLSPLAATCEVPKIPINPQSIFLFLHLLVRLQTNVLRNTVVIVEVTEWLF